MLCCLLSSTHSASSGAILSTTAYHNVWWSSSRSSVTSSLKRYCDTESKIGYTYTYRRPIKQFIVFAQAVAYLIPEELFKMELEEGVERVQITITVLRTLKQLFHKYRQRLPKYFRHNQTIKLWDFPASLVFQRLDHIMERLLMIEVPESTSV